MTMSVAAEIRPLSPGDIATVAKMFQRQFRPAVAVSSASLEAYLDTLFLSGPFASPTMPSLVHARADGLVTGFIGVTSQPMQIGDRPLKVAVCGALMVEGRAEDPMAGARLLKSFLAGEQDLSLSETAGDATLSMWRQLRGDLLTNHSLDWLRVLRPASFATETAQRRMGIAGLLSPLSQFVDRRLRKKWPVGSWASVSDAPKIAGGASSESVSVERFLAFAREHSDSFPIRRLWTDEALSQLAADIPLKSELGELRTALVHSRTGVCLGGYAYYFRAGKSAQVLDVLAGEARAGVVIDCLFRDADESGAVAVRGRSNPAMLDALLERRCLMFRQGASVIAGRDKDLIERFKQGDAAFNGLIGERWSRLVGDNFV